MYRVLLCAVVLVLCGSAWAEEVTLPRYLEFRDGTVLKLPVVDEEWKISVVHPDGKVEVSTLRLASLDRLTLQTEPVMEKKRALLEIIKQLGADRFQDREMASDRLLKMGAVIRPDLEGALEVINDLEIRSRIQQILNQLPAPPAGQANKVIDTFDAFVGKEVIRGDAGEGSIPVKIDGQTRRLPRKEVRAMSVKAPEINDLIITRRVQGGFRRIETNDFPPGCMEESFDTAPNGKKLTIGENIEKLFIMKGFTLSTSIGTSHVSVNDFVVQGKSRGYSAATHQPLFQGEVTIRFCRPGNENVPAGVSHFGLWIAHVMPRGTSMVAYDLQGRELGSIATTRDGHEFLAVQSPVPIHRIKIVPNLQVDPDFTLDDFIYQMVRSGEGAHPEKYLIQFADGERVLCTDVSVAQQNIKLHGIPAGLPDYSRPTADVLRIAAPDREKQAPNPAPVKPGVFAELRDGSVVFGAPTPKAGVPNFARRPQLLKEKDNLVGLWSNELPKTTWPDKVEFPAVWEVEKKAWRTVTDVAFTEEAVAWTLDDKRRARSYFEIGPVLLRKPAGDPEVGSWRLRTIQGEEFALGNVKAPPISGTFSKEIEAKWGDITLKIPAADIVSVFKVMKE